MPEHYDEMNLLLYLEGQLESERAQRNFRARGRVPRNVVRCCVRCSTRACGCANH